LVLTAAPESDRRLVKQKWNDRATKEWNDGIVEKWVNSQHSNIPVFHQSNQDAEVFDV
jgi:hypothetical protein